MTLRIHVHDNSGHPFQVQLSRALAARGHSVLHTHMTRFQTPKGKLEPQPNDPPSLRIEGLDLGTPFPKYSYWRRWQQERLYGRALSALIERDRPDVFLASNTPLDMLQIVQETCRRLGVRFVFWVQDLYGYAIAQILGPRFGGLGRLIGAYYEHKERRLLRRSDHAVVITEDFRPFLLEAGLRDDATTVVPNWAPLEELPRRDKSNAWSLAHGLDRNFVFLYSGTLGLKHDPALLLELADRFQSDPQVRVVVISEGIGADWLRSAQADKPRPNLLLLPFQNFEAMPEVVASADVLVALLEQSAGVFSVPSKVLTYLCAGRPILLAAPMENQAARLIQEAEAGSACPAGDHVHFLAEADGLRSDPERLDRNGQSARRYAESRFDIERIADRFMEVLDPASARAPRTSERRRAGASSTSPKGL